MFVQMKTLTYTYVDKSDWPDGPWKSEPDKKQWQDQTTKLPCLIVRGPFGALCGYVGVTKDHPAFGTNWEDNLPLSMHGGQTFGSLCVPDNKEHDICHVVEPGEEDHVWWIGFDCAHSGDFCPASGKEGIFLKYNSTYKNWQYVENEVTQLAAQLSKLHEACAKGAQEETSRRER